MESSMYNRLLLLPIFTGLTTSELTQILAHIHLEFQQFDHGDVLAAQDDRCDKLTYVLSGVLRAELVDPTNKFALTELMDKPFLIEPYNLYGLNQNYEHTYIANEKAYTVSISKQEFHSIMLNYRIPRTNALNLISAKVHKQSRLLREPEPPSVEGKIIQFLSRVLLTERGTKELQMKMEDLAAYIQETRLNVSITLREWNEKGLITQPRRGMIVIPEFGKLPSHH